MFFNDGFPPRGRDCPSSCGFPKLGCSSCRGKNKSSKFRHRNHLHHHPHIYKSCFPVLLPSHLYQVYKCCLYEGCCGRNATDWIYLIVYPLFTGLMIMMINMMIRHQQRKISVIMLALLSCHPACFIQFL